jgi:hypothetical protein
MFSMEKISTISTPRHSSRSASGCPAFCADNRPRFRLSVHTTAGWKFPDLRSIFWVKFTSFIKMCTSYRNHCPLL